MATTIDDCDPLLHSYQKDTMVQLSGDHPVSSSASTAVSQDDDSEILQQDAERERGDALFRLLGFSTNPFQSSEEDSESATLPRVT